MKKISSKKLSLTRETLKQLSAEELANAAGAKPNSRAQSLCYSVCTDRTSCGIACSAINCTR